MGPLKPLIPSHRRPVAKPVCTHIEMDRLFGSYYCQICLRKPSHGWVYVCKQDSRPSLPTPLPSTVAPISYASIENCMSNPSELALIGFSTSEIKAAETGVLTVAQLLKIAEQKQHLRSVIANELGKPVESSTPTNAPENIPPRSNADPPVGDVAQRKDSVEVESKAETHNHTGKFPRRTKQRIQACKFQCCHSCRPYYRDRIYLSVDSVFAGEVEPLHPSDVAELQVLDANVLRNISIPTTTTQPLRTVESTDLITLSTRSSWGTRQSDFELREAANNAAKRFYALRSNYSADSPEQDQPSTPGLRNTVKQAFHSFHSVLKGPRQSSSAGSDITLPPSDTSGLHTYDEDAEEVDLGLLRDGLKRIVDSGACPGSAASARHSRQGSIASDSSEGSEVEVEGGVALTEEAVEMNMPDIMTQAR